ncbi:MAG TPA: CHAT domain-containing protein [Streptosporangiaceae bacterium]|nr:CHAT domain-containing protein [Streptosporangiaceae bacterium]
MALQPVDVFVRLVDQWPLVCRRCGRRDEYQVPVAFDWRDYEALAMLRRSCPTVLCSGCGESAVLDVPVVVLRPGDPARWLLGVPPGSSCEQDINATASLLHRLRGVAAALPPDRPIRVSQPQLVMLADRYSGFALADVSYDGTQTAPSSGDEFAGIRPQITVPDVTAILLDLFNAADGQDVLRVYEQHPVMLEPSWAPVFRVVGRRLVAALETPEAARPARSRLVELNRRWWPHDPVPLGSWEALNEAGRAALARAHGFATLTNVERAVLLDQMIQLIEEYPEQRSFLVEKLLVFFVRLYEAPQRVPEDLEVVVPAGLAAVRYAEDVFGTDHPMTLMAINDLGAALHDRQRGDPHAAQEQAIELLTTAARVAADAADPALADILHNLGTAYAHRQRDGRSANQRQAEEYFLWSLHLAQTLTPEQPRSTVPSRLALAAILRERRSGNRLAATIQALAIYQDILDDPDQVGLLSPAEQVLTGANRVMALHQLQQLDPGAVDATEVIAAAEAMAATAGLAPSADPQSLSNVGSVLGSLYHDRGFQEPALLARAVDLTALAYAAAQASHSPAHPDVLRMGLNHAAMLGMPVNEATDTAPGSPAVRYYNAEGAHRLLTELLEACPQDRLPAHTAAIANNLGRHQFSMGRFAAACSAFRTSMAAMDRLYGAASDPEAQLAELGVPGEPLSWSATAGWLVSASLRADDAAGAVAAIEESRSKLLADKLHTATPDPASGPAESDGPVLYVGVSAVGSWVILIPPRGRPWFLESGLFASDLRPAVLSLRQADDVAERSTALNTIAALLRPHITGPAYDLLAENKIPDVGVVASGLLSGLPLHVLPASDEGSCWLELASVRYLPSATIARRIESMPPSRRARVVAVANPDLALARHEAALLGHAMGPVESPPQRGDRRRWLLAVLPEVAHLLLSCHARWLEHDPLRSPIELDSHNVLRLADLVSAKDSAPDVVVASCCVTGVTVEVLADEILGFGTGMLLAGARAVIVSNWELGDRFSALTLAVFYQETAHAAEPAKALRSAQLWLRQLTVADLLALGDGQPAQGRRLDLPNGFRRELAALRFTPMGNDLTVRPYANPAHWGGYSFYGTRIRPGGDAVDGAA